MITTGKKEKRVMALLLALVMVIGLLLVNGITARAEVVIGNSGYPYGKAMGATNITLVCDATGATTYQWQQSDSENGDYTDITGANGETYTFEPINLNWYRCVVDGTASKAVQAVKPGQDGRTWTKPYSSWYLTNGKAAYFVNDSKFDVVGEYTKNNIKYMLCTSFNTYWTMYAGDGTASSHGSGQSAAPAKIKFAFNDLAVEINVELGDTAGNFSFGCDTQLGNFSTSGDYNDKAALVASLNGDKTLKHIAMVGAAAVNNDTDPDAPAFVIEPKDNPMFWVGNYYNRQVYAYNTGGDGSDSFYTQQVVKKYDNTEGSVVTSIQGEDSGMTISWKGVTSVQFAFKVGTAKETGAVSGNVNYLNDNIDGLEASTTYIFKVKDDEGNTTATYNITSNPDGAVPLEGTDDNGNAYDLTGKTIEISKAGSDSAPATLEIEERPNPDDAEQVGDEDYVRPQDVADNEVFTTENSITIHPSTEAKSAQRYRIYNADGTEIAGQDWMTVDENGDITFTGLSENTDYIIKAFIPATETTPRSYISAGVTVKTMGTIAVTVPTELSFVQDGLEHEFAITTEPADTIKEYSLAEDDDYTEGAVKLKNPGVYTVYYKASKDNYRTVYGSFEIEILPAAATDIVAVAKDYTGVYDGKAHSIEIEVVVPETGAVITYGTKEGEYTLNDNPTYTDAGTYKVYYKVSAEGRDDKTGSTDVVITKADSTFTKNPAANTLTGNDSAQELIEKGTAEGGEAQYALGTDEKTAPEAGWSTSVPTGTKPGTYYVWYRITGDKNHNDTAAKCLKVTIEPQPVASKGTISSDGIYVLRDYPAIVAGLVHEKSNSEDDVEFRWLVCDDRNPTKWIEISPWTKNNEWLNWTPEEAGNYVIVCQARVIGNENDSLVAESVGIIHRKNVMKDICQIPYGDGRYLMGVESIENPEKKYTYDISIIDCSLLVAGKDAIVYTTGRVDANVGNSLWTLWEPEYGYYWTLFRIYDEDGKLLDQTCYGFANVY